MLLTSSGRWNFLDANRAIEARVQSLHPLPDNLAHLQRLSDTVMGKVINLNKRRKSAERERKADIAAVNRARFGRSKAERDLVEQRTTRETRLLDQHRIDGEDAP